MHRLRCLTLIALVALLAGELCAQTPIPTPVFTGFDNNGDPIAAGKLCVYVSGGSTPASTYTDQTLGTANANPVILDTAGRHAVFLQSGQTYKFVLRQPGTTTDCTTGAIVWTADGIQAIPSSSANLDVLGTAGEALTAGQAVYLSDGSGSKTAGQWYKADSGNTYSSTSPVIGMVPNSISSAATGTIRIAGSVTGLTSLTIGANYFLSTAGALTATAPTNARLVGRADTTSSVVLALGPSLATTTSPGAVGVLPNDATKFFDGTGVYSRAKVATYTGTLANVSNTASETTILTFTVPANTWSDGDVIVVELLNLEKNNKGTDGTTTVKVNVGAGSQVTIATPTFTNSASEYTNRRPFVLQRMGSTVEVFGGADAPRADWGTASDNSIVHAVGSSTPANFTADQVVTLKLTLSAADSSYYVKPQVASIVHLKN